MLAIQLAPPINISRPHPLIPQFLKIIEKKRGSFFCVLHINYHAHWPLLRGSLWSSIQRESVGLPETRYLFWVAQHCHNITLLRVDPHCYCRYFSSLAWLLPLSTVWNVPIGVLCIPSLLRLQNVFLTVMLLVTLQFLLRKVHHSHGSISTSVSGVGVAWEHCHVLWLCVPAGLLFAAVNLTMFPVLFFFSFLYYTDVGATLLVLWGYALTLTGNHFFSATVSNRTDLCV